MTAPFEVEATVTAGPLTGHRMIVTVYYSAVEDGHTLTLAKVEVEDRMVPIDIAAQVLAHTQEARP